jgi:hypothetical protein
VAWDFSSYDGMTEGIYAIYGELSTDGALCDLKAKVTVKVGDPEEYIDLGASMKLTVGDTLRLSPTIYAMSYDEADLEWGSGDPSVASVSNDGTLVALKPGRTTVSLSIKGRPGLTGECLVVVIRKQALELGNGWGVYRKLDEKFRLESATALTLTTNAQGDFGGADTARNVVWRLPADGDFDISVKVAGTATMNYQSFALFARVKSDPRYFMGAMRRYHSYLPVGGDNHIFQSFSWNGGNGEQQVADPRYGAPVWLRLTKSGTAFQSYYSYDGPEGPWNKINANTVTNGGFSGKTGAEIEIGVLATNSNTSGGDTGNAATFEDFRYSGASTGGQAALIPFASPANPGFSAESSTLEASTSAVRARTDMLNNQEGDQSGQVILAVYDGKGRLVALKATPFSLVGGEEAALDSEISGLSAEAGWTARVFVWSDECLPLDEAYEITLARS